MQGNPQFSFIRRVRPLLALGLGALTGSMVLVVIAAMISGSLLESPRTLRLTVTASLAVAVLLLDLRALIGKKTFVSGPRRQAAKWLQYTGLSEWKIGFLWGLDVGTGISTFRMTSGTWLFLVLAGVGGLIPAWLGVGYGLGFSLAVVIASFSSRTDALATGSLGFFRSTYVVVAGTATAVMIAASLQ